MKWIALALIATGCLSDPSDPESFDTVEEQLVGGMTFTSTDVHKAILDNKTVTSVLTSTSPGGVISLAVDIDITHTFRGDLVVSLISPTGTTVVLSNREGGTADNYVVTGLDKSAAFANADAYGTWTLKVADTAAQDTGVINAFRVTLVTSLGPSAVTFTSNNAHQAIPDNTATGVTATIASTLAGSLVTASVSLDITHTYRGDLVVTLISPSGRSLILSGHEGGTADNIVLTAKDVSATFANDQAQGTWILKVVDGASQDVGILNSFALTLSTLTLPPAASFTGSATVGTAIPDNTTAGLTSTIVATPALSIASVQVKLNITHTWRGDLAVTLTSPVGETRTVIAPPSSDSADNIVGTFDVAGFTAGSNGTGTWTLKVTDRSTQDTGTLVSWSLGVNAPAP